MIDLSFPSENISLANAISGAAGLSCAAARSKFAQIGRKGSTRSVLADCSGGVRIKISLPHGDCTSREDAAILDESVSWRKDLLAFCRIYIVLKVRKT